ncbi:MAG: hypothetical protein ACI9FB_002238 [Candidatus Azotimanducaceae bacterium]|jgi:hypothetical protein
MVYRLLYQQWHHAPKICLESSKQAHNRRAKLDLIDTQDIDSHLGFKQFSVLLHFVFKTSLPMPINGKILQVTKSNKISKNQNLLLVFNTKKHTINRLTRIYCCYKY